LLFLRQVQQTWLMGIPMDIVMCFSMIISKG
jgi:hypothetical protein